jgi:hypothetical protein
MFTDSHNGDDRLVETDAVHEIREAGTQPFYGFFTLFVLFPIVKMAYQAALHHMSFGRWSESIEREDCGVQELDGLETAISSANVPYHCVAGRCGTPFVSIPQGLW